MTDIVTPNGARRLRIVFFSPSFGDGGVERDTVNLANGFSALGYPVAILLRQTEGAFQSQLQSGVERIRLPGGRPEASGQALADYLGAHAVAAVISANDADDRIAVRVKAQLADRSGARFYIRVGTAIVSRLREDRLHWLTGGFRRRQLARLFLACDGVITTSTGAAREIVAELGIPPARVTAIPNPTLTADVERLAAVEPGHPWFAAGQPPVIMALGRLARVKDYPTLIRAFAQLRAERACRLLVLGRGRQRDRLLQLATRLGVGEDVDLPGFFDNPYASLRRASLLAVSSLREGGPIVLIEALALGIPVVSTDCPTGPREILQDGRYGRLVPPGDPAALAAAMRETLDNPPDAALLRQGAAPYTQADSCRRHLQAMGLAPV